MKGTIVTINIHRLSLRYTVMTLYQLVWEMKSKCLPINFATNAGIRIIQIPSDCN